MQRKLIQPGVYAYIASVLTCGLYIGLQDAELIAAAAAGPPMTRAGVDAARLALGGLLFMFHAHQVSRAEGGTAVVAIKWWDKC